MFFALLVACGVPEDDFAEQYAEASCAYQMACGGWNSEETCISFLLEDAETEYIECADHWDEDLALRCLNELDDLAAEGECTRNAPSCDEMHCV